jgi:hypothetical protein
MRLPASSDFFDERERFALRHCCEECVLYDAARKECAHEWPNETHLMRYYEQTPSEIVFCKEFELA